MDIYDMINQLLKDKKLTKMAFAEILQNFKPMLKSTGEAPI